MFDSSSSVIVTYTSEVFVNTLMESPVGTTYELWETCTDDWIIVGGACALSDPTLVLHTIGHWYR